MDSPGAEKRSFSRGHMARPRTRMVALAAALMLVLAACDDADGDEEADTTGDGGTAEVTVWFNGETIPTDEFASLEEEHNVVVNFDVRGDDILSDMLRMREAGEQLPDIVEIDSNTVPAFIEAGLIQPMTEQVEQFEEEDPEIYDTVFPSVWEDGTYEGEIYHAPIKNLYDAIYYNIDLLEEAGVEVPFDSWFDVLEAGRQLRETNPDLPAYFGTGGTSHDRMFHWLTNFGVPFDGNIPDLASEQGFTFIEWAQTLFEEGIVDPGFMIGRQDESLGAFVRGELPILMEGLNGGVAFMDIEGFEYGSGWATTPMPTHEDEGGEQMGVPRGISLGSESEHADEATLVLRYLMEPEIAMERYLELDAAPIMSSPLFESEELAESQPYF
ncbi:MAG: extracellular solute-binding protein, partial [Nitriliruptorales bacterium]|nr:extracellular solute-binding protein [Nitriliruptorales bacterium]